MKYIWSVFLILLIITFAVLAYKGSEIHESICPEVRTARVKEIIIEGDSFVCLQSECVRDGKVYEVYKDQGFFNSTYRVKEIDVMTIKDIPVQLSDSNMTAIVSGIDRHSKAYYASIPAEGLEDGEAVAITRGQTPGYYGEGAVIDLYAKNT